MKLLERLGRRDGTEKKEQAAIFAGRTNNVHEEGYQELKNGIHRRIVDDMTAEQQQVLDGRHTRQEVEAVITRYVQRVVEEDPFAVPRGERSRLVSDICDEILGLGPIEPFLKDDAVTEIMINGPKKIYVEKMGKIHLTQARFQDQAHLMAIIEKIVSPLGRHVDEASPIVDARLEDGSRVNIVKDSITALGHPSISPDGKYLYFVSDAVGGFGGKDIYRCKISGSETGPMENLGEEINTSGDEMFPYVRDSVTLYFASNGHPGMGGLDLFKATKDSLGNWSVENMGFPINSSSDDFGITFEGKKEKGFFSSNRNDAKGFDHLYSFEKPVITVHIEGFVNDVDEYPIENAIVRIVGRDGLNAKVPTKKDGSYQVELERDIKYVMMASAQGYLNQNYELHTSPEEKNETYIVDFYLSPISKPVVIENIFYDFDKATLRPESKKALDEMIKMLNDNPNVTIELGAHTDRKGSDKYNERLAQRRAQSVVDYLIAGGIAQDRLEAKGYGESVPKTINKRMAKQYDFLNEGDVLSEEFILKLSPEQQEIADQINRRTEFKVIRTNYNLF